jgi:excisionase family DNA binding protein
MNRDYSCFLAGRHYSTGEVAKILRVSARTVIKWFNKEELKGFKIPGSRYRRIPHDNLIDFMEENDLPESLLEDYFGSRKTL